jgi:hypothetical protein
MGFVSFFGLNLGIFCCKGRGDGGEGAVGLERRQSAPRNPWQHFNLRTGDSTQSRGGEGAFKEDQDKQMLDNSTLFSPKISTVNKEKLEGERITTKNTTTDFDRAPCSFLHRQLGMLHFPGTNNDGYFEMAKSVISFSFPFQASPLFSLAP